MCPGDCEGVSACLPTMNPEDDGPALSSGSVISSSSASNGSCRVESRSPLVLTCLPVTLLTTLPAPESDDFTEASALESVTGLEIGGSGDGGDEAQ